MSVDIASEPLKENFDWRTSSLHVDWLGGFKKPKNLDAEIESFSKLYSRLLKVRLEITVQEFISEELLTSATSLTGNNESDCLMMLSDKGARLVAELQKTRKKEETIAKHLSHQTLLDGDFEEARNVKISFYKKFHSTRGNNLSYKNSDFLVFDVIALKSAMSEEAANDPDKWLASFSSTANFQSSFLRFASELSPQTADLINEDSIAHYRAAFFMEHLWPGEKGGNWIPKHFQAIEPITNFRAPEIQIKAKRAIAQKGGKTTFLDSEGNETSVEQIALEYYRDEGFQGIHLENKGWWVLCHCLYWNVIYADIPFVKEYQAKMKGVRLAPTPPDFHTKIFYRRRNDLIVTRHQEIKQIAIENRANIEKAFSEKWEPFRAKFWEGIELSPISFNQHLEILRLLNVEQVIAICDRILHNPGANSIGFPDLFLTRNKRIKLVEVKQPTEKIMDHQIAWHEYLTNIGITVEVCRVATSDTV